MEYGEYEDGKGSSHKESYFKRRRMDEVVQTRHNHKTIFMDISNEKIEKSQGGLD